MTDIYNSVSEISVEQGGAPYSEETVKTSAGKFPCIVVEPQFRGEGIFVSKGKSLKVWLTDDEYKMPVKMESEVFIGSVSAELLEYKRN